MKKSTIIIIPAEGDSPETEQWYINALREHYYRQGKELKIVTFRHTSINCTSKALNRNVRRFFARHDFSERAEIHAQGGLGASVAYRMLILYPRLISRVFFIGGAPSNAMTGIAKLFHRYISRLWYFSHIPFFADDPNPWRDPVVDQIRASSTAIMRANPLLYRNQLIHLGTWQLSPAWRLPEFCEAYFVPNGETVRPTWWDNSFNNDLAVKIWSEHGVGSTRRPGGNFSFYSMMPAAELFRVMDEVRAL